MLFFVGRVATIVVTVFVTRIAKRALDRVIEPTQQQEPVRAVAAPEAA